MYSRAIGCLLCAGLLSSCVTGPAPERTRLRGQVLSSGQPLSGVRVRIDGKSPGVFSGPDGWYELTGVTPGPRHLVATIGDRRRALVVRALPAEVLVVPPIELDPGETVGLDLLLDALEVGAVQPGLVKRLRSLQPEVLARLGRTMGDADLAKAAEWLRHRLSLDGAEEPSIDDLRMAVALWRQTGDGGMKEGPPPALPALTAPRVLYDPAQRGSPGAQGWWFLTDPPLGSHAVETVEEGGVWLNSTAVRTEKAGYATEDPVTAEWMRHPNLARLDVERGFTVQLDLQLAQERHIRDDRAGFSIIVVGHNLSAVELGFWSGRVWAQSDRGEPLFHDSRAESAPYPFKGRRVRVELTLLGNRYQLTCGGTPVMSGPLRNYTRFGGYPYDVPDYLFLGDDTGSAQARFQLGRVTLLPLGPVPSVLAKSGGLSDRTVARTVASQTAMNPEDALGWLRKNRESLLHGGAQVFSVNSLEIVLRMAQTAGSAGPGLSWGGGSGARRPAGPVSDGHDAAGLSNTPGRVADVE